MYFRTFICLGVCKCFRLDCNDSLLNLVFPARSRILISKERIYFYGFEHFCIICLLCLMFEYQNYFIWLVQMSKFRAEFVTNDLVLLSFLCNFLLTLLTFPPYKGIKGNARALRALYSITRLYRLYALLGFVCNSRKNVWET